MRKRCITASKIKSYRKHMYLCTVCIKKLTRNLASNKGFIRLGSYSSSCLVVLMPSDVGWDYIGVKLGARTLVLMSTVTLS